MPIHAQSTLAEIDAALADGSTTLAQARKVLLPRSKRYSASGRRAAAWLGAHKAAPAAAKPAPKGPNPKTVRANASGEAPGSTGWWNAYHARGAYAQGVTRMGEDFAAQEWAALPEAVRRALLDSTVSNDAARIPA